MEIKDLLLEHFLSWQKRSGKIRTQKDFAEYIGISNSLLNHYMSGLRQPSQENVDKLYAAFGDDRFYEISGFEKTDHRLTYIKNNWSKFSEEEKQKAMELLSRYDTRTVKKSDTSPKSP